MKSPLKLLLRGWKSKSCPQDHGALKPNYSRLLRPNRSNWKLPWRESGELSALRMKMELHASARLKSSILMSLTASLYGHFRLYRQNVPREALLLQPWSCGFFGRNWKVQWNSPESSLISSGYGKSIVV